VDAGIVWTRPPHVDMLAIEMRKIQQFASHFNVPPASAVELQGQLWRREPYIQGTPLSCSTDLLERKQVLRVLLEQYAAFAEREATPPVPEVTHAAIATIRDSAPESLPARIASNHDVEMRALARALPMLPAHGDLGGQNVLIGNGGPWILDWDNAGEPLPLLHDILYLMIREAELGRVDLLEAFLSGALDEEVRRLLARNGCLTIPSSNLVMLAHAYLIRFHLKSRDGHRDTEARNVDSAWNPLRRYCSSLM
jgi:hypothetical protein